MADGRQTRSATDTAGKGSHVQDFIALLVADIGYLDQKAEWDVIEKAVFGLGILPMDAKCYVVGAAATGGHATESLVRRSLADLARGIRRRDGRIGKADFDFLVRAALDLAHGGISEETATDMVRAACDAAALRPRRRGPLRSRRWYVARRPAEATA